MHNQQKPASAQRGMGWTKTRNVIYDAMPLMSGAELKCTLALVRETFGYHQQWVRLSYDDFRRKTGLSSQSTLAAALKAVAARGFFMRGDGRDLWRIGPELDPDAVASEEWREASRKGRHKALPLRGANGEGAGRMPAVRGETEKLGGEANNSIDGSINTSLEQYSSGVGRYHSTAGPVAAGAEPIRSGAGPDSSSAEQINSGDDPNSSRCGPNSSIVGPNSSIIEPNRSIAGSISSVFDLNSSIIEPNSSIFELNSSIAELNSSIIELKEDAKSLIIELKREPKSSKIEPLHIIKKKIPFGERKGESARVPKREAAQPLPRPPPPNS